MRLSGTSSKRGVWTSKAASINPILISPHKYVMKLKQEDKIEIIWRDTFGFTGWNFEDEIKEKIAEVSKENTSSVGYLIGEIGNFIVICTSLEPHPDFAKWGTYKAIPKGTILKIRKLK